MGGLVSVAGPVLEALGSYIAGKTDEIAVKSGVPPVLVNKVSDTVGALLTGDSGAMDVVMAEVDKARAHDVATNVHMPPMVDLLRGLVRPVITLLAFFWYVYARTTGVAVSGEDYALIGGIVAFWFGFRPFEKAGQGLPGLAGTVAKMLTK